MAKAKAKGAPATTEDTTTGEGTALTEAVDPKVEKVTSERDAAHEEVVALQEALAAAQGTLDEAQSALDALTAPPAPEPVTGPRVKLEHSGEIVAVPEGHERERRLLLHGKNYEHVSDAEDQGETIWVYRHM